MGDAVRGVGATPAMAKPANVALPPASSDRALQSMFMRKNVISQDPLAGSRVSHGAGTTRIRIAPRPVRPQSWSHRMHGPVAIVPFRATGGATPANGA